MARQVAVLLFADVDILDFAGPFEVFGVTGGRDGPELFEVVTVAAERSPISARNGLSINPTYSFEDCPTCQVLVVPGGPGTRREKNNAAMLDFIRRHADNADHVLSVCTGALLLAKAGLLDGLSATTHHHAMDELRNDAPATTVLDQARVVDNGKFILSAGVSAGIDAALYTVAQLHGLDQAIETAARMEYDWRLRVADGSSIARTA